MCILVRNQTTSAKNQNSPALLRGVGIRHCHLTNASDSMGHEGHFKRTDVTFVFLKVFFVKVVAFMRLATFTIHVVTRKQQFGVCDCNIYCS